MQLPIIILNFKAYKEATGPGADRLARACESVSKATGINIVAAPQLADIRGAVAVGVTVFAQHIDPVKPGAYTGHAVPENLRAAGVSGTLINHSERRLTMHQIEDCIGAAKAAGLTTVCCAATPAEAKEIAKLDPDFVAIEPPELIGSGVSVSKARPEAITQSVTAVRETNPLVRVICGAGISTGDDAKRALELGAVGIILASGVVKSGDPQKALAGLASAMK